MQSMLPSDSNIHFRNVIATKVQRSIWSCTSFFIILYDFSIVLSLLKHWKISWGSFWFQVSWLKHKVWKYRILFPYCNTDLIMHVFDSQSKSMANMSKYWTKSGWGKRKIHYDILCFSCFSLHFCGKVIRCSSLLFA